MLPLNPENPRIIVPLFAPTLGALAAQAAAAAAAPEADLVELRLDPLPVPDYAAALDLVRRAVAKPLIVTVRTAGEGGRAALDPAAYGAALTGLLARGGVDALDIEWRAGTALAARLRDAAHAAGAAALFSEHHFAGTPPVDAMEQTLTGMLDAGADIAKLAVMPRSRADAARLLLATALVRDARPGAALITMSMGPDGAATRYCGGAFGSGATFGTLAASSAPGQPPAARLRQKLLTGADAGR